MTTLYKTIDGALHFRDAWVYMEELVMHRGRVGDHGETATEPLDQDPNQAVEDALAAARAEGFTECGTYHRLIVQLQAGAKIEARRQVLRYVDECLAGTGNGRCTGGDTVRDAINLYVEVVEIEAAVRSIDEVLDLFAVPGDWLIALVEGDEFWVVWPRDYLGDFSVPSEAEIRASGRLLPADCHPDTRELLADDFFWNSINPHAPHGNDAGEDLMGNFLSSNAESRRRPAEFLHQTFDHYRLPWPVSRTLEEKELRQLFAEDEVSIPFFDDSVIALAFAQLKVLGACDRELQNWALTAIDRQALPIVIELRGWQPEERLAGLRCTADTLRLAPTSAPAPRAVTRLERRTERSTTFWEVETIGVSIIRRWGKIGCKGREHHDDYGSSRFAKTLAHELIMTKLNEGYVRVGEGAEAHMRTAAPTDEADPAELARLPKRLRELKCRRHKLCGERWVPNAEQVQFLLEKIEQDFYGTQVDCPACGTAADLSLPRELEERRQERAAKKKP